MHPFVTRLSEDLHLLADRATAARATTTAPIRRCRVLASRFTRDGEHLTCELVCHPGDYQLVLRNRHVRIDRFPDALSAMARVCVMEEELVKAGWHLSAYETRDALIEHFTPADQPQSVAFINTGPAAASTAAGGDDRLDSRNADAQARR